MWVCWVKTRQVKAERDKIKIDKIEIDKTSRYKVKVDFRIKEIVIIVVDKVDIHKHGG